MSKFLDRLKDTLVESDDKSKAQPHDPVASPTHIQPPMAWPSPPPTNLLTPQGAIYEKLKTKTDFKSTEVGKILDGYLAPLSAMSMDEATRLKVAVQMAKTKDNLNPGAVLSTFDKLKATLEAERETFNRSVASLDADISSSRARHQELQKQLADLSADMEGKIKLKTETANEFNAAADARTAELETEKQHYASLLQ